MKCKRYIQIEKRCDYNVTTAIEFLNNYIDNKHNFIFEICNIYNGHIRGIAIAKNREYMIKFITNITNKLGNDYRFDFNCTRKEILTRDS